jgi:hypothetical protein
LVHSDSLLSSLPFGEGIDGGSWGHEDTGLDRHVCVFEKFIASGIIAPVRNIFFISIANCEHHDTYTI